MLSALKPTHLARYKDIAILLFKYGGHDLVEMFGMAGQVDVPLSGLRARRADELAHDLEALGPTFIKLGQLMSSRADLLPAEYLRALSRLHDQVEPFPVAEVESIFREEIGLSVAQAFASFDTEPIAAASLGQVHRATTFDGAEVVVKVQRPGIRRRLADDLESLYTIARLLDDHTAFGRRHHFLDIVQQFRRTLMLELDYTREADNLRKLGANLAEFERIVVPQPVDELTTSRVLTMQYVEGSKFADWNAEQRAEAGGTELAEVLFQAYLKQFLDDGFFHADPHPGNVLITPDRRIALLDLGMVGRLSLTMQEQLLSLLLAIGEGRSEDAANLAIKLSQVGENFEAARFRREIAEVVSMTRDARVEQMQIGRLMLDLSRACGNTGLRVPAEIMILGKTLLNLDQIARALAPEFDPNGMIRTYAMETTRRRVLRSLRPAQIAGTLMELKQFAQNLPRRLDRVLDAVADNNLRLRIDAIDEDRLISGLQKIANRISVGLVLASLIVGAAMLMDVETSYTLLGYPALAMICFVAAAAIGFFLVARIVWSDFGSRHRRR